jgi:hypothetical protein
VLDLIAMLVVVRGIGSDDQDFDYISETHAGINQENAGDVTTIGEVIRKVYRH